MATFDIRKLRASYRGQAILALVLLWTGLITPVMTVEKLWFFKDTYSILSAIGELFDEGKWALGGLIGFFSVVTPTAKLLAIIGVSADGTHPTERAWVAKLVELLGKWSMLDVFIVALMILAIKANGVVSVFDHQGIYYFAASVLLSLVASFGLKRDAEAASVIVPGDEEPP